mgnify:CR=1 FL=1
MDKTPLNMKWALRKMVEFLPPTGPDESWIPQLVQTLWTFSNVFLEAEEIDAGRIHFDAEASYGQLAEAMRCDRETAKWRCQQLRNRYPGVFDWKRGKYSCKFQVRLESGNRLPISESGNVLPISAHSDSSQVTGHVEIGNRSSESGNTLTPLSSSVESFLSSKVNEKTDKTRSNPVNPKPTIQETTASRSLRSSKTIQEIPPADLGHVWKNTGSYNICLGCSCTGKSARAKQPCAHALGFAV